MYHCKMFCSGWTWLTASCNDGYWEEVWGFLHYLVNLPKHRKISSESNAAPNCLPKLDSLLFRIFRILSWNDSLCILFTHQRFAFATSSDSRYCFLLPFFFKLVTNLKIHGVTLKSFMKSENFSYEKNGSVLFWTRERANLFCFVCFSDFQVICSSGGGHIFLSFIHSGPFHHKLFVFSFAAPTSTSSNMCRIFVCNNRCVHKLPHHGCNISPWYDASNLCS